MISKKVLENIRKRYANSPTFQTWCDIIKQDLERLEQLEGLVKTLDIEVKILNQDLEKYKMAIEILKDFFNVGEIYGDYLINANGFNKLSKLDYELLKGVLIWQEKNKI